MNEVLQVAEGDSGYRLDLVLAKQTGQSRSYWTREIKAGRVYIDGLPAKAGRLLESGERVSAVRVKEVATRAEPPKLKIIYEDSDMLAIDKPAGLIMYSSKPTEASVVDFIRNLVKDSDLERPGIVHRLDRDTSGVLVVAKHPAAKTHLQDQFRKRLVNKTYLALVRGRLRPEAAVIDLPIGRDKMKPTTRDVVARGRAATTKYRVLEEYRGYSLVEAKPETGRTHQLRVHFAHLGHPIAGDSIYGGRERPFGLARLFLHAAELNLTSPSGKRLNLKSNLPSDLNELINRLRRSV